MANEDGKDKAMRALDVAFSAVRNFMDEFSGARDRLIKEWREAGNAGPAFVYWKVVDGKVKISIAAKEPEAEVGLSVMGVLV